MVFWWIPSHQDLQILFWPRQDQVDPTQVCTKPSMWLTVVSRPFDELTHWSFGTPDLGCWNRWNRTRVPWRDLELASETSKDSKSCWSLRIWTALTSVFQLSQTFTDLQWFLMSLPTSSLSSQILVELCWLGFGAQTFPPCVTLFGMVGGQYDCNLKHSVPRVFMDFWPRWTIASMLSTWLSWSYALLSMECWCWRATGSSDIEHIRATSHFATRRTYGVTPVAGSKLRVKFDTFLVTVWCSVWDSGQGSLTNHMNHVFQTNAFAKFAMNCNECVAPLAAWRCGLAWRDLRPQPWTSSWIWCRLLKSWTRWCSCLGSGIPWDSMGFQRFKAISHYEP